MSVSLKLLELDKQLEDTLGRLTKLIENRSAWADGIEGCREGLSLLTYARERLQSVNESAKKLEAESASQRAEIDRWSKMHAELSVVERELRSECEQKRIALEEQANDLGRVRMLLRKQVSDLSRELASL